jgi:hypothetical protein
VPTKSDGEKEVLDRKRSRNLRTTKENSSKSKPIDGNSTARGKGADYNDAPKCKPNEMGIMQERAVTNSWRPHASSKQEYPIETYRWTLRTTRKGILTQRIQGADQM